MAPIQTTEQHAVFHSVALTAPPSPPPHTLVACCLLFIPPHTIAVDICVCVYVWIFT